MPTLPHPLPTFPDFADDGHVAVWLDAAMRTHPEVDDPIDRAVSQWHDAAYTADKAYRSSLVAALDLHIIRSQRRSANDDSFVQRPETRAMLAAQVESVIRDATVARLAAYDEARRVLAAAIDEYMRCPNPQCDNGQVPFGTTLTGAAAVTTTCATCHGTGRRPLTAPPAPTPVLSLRSPTDQPVIHPTVAERIPVAALDAMVAGNFGPLDEWLAAYQGDPTVEYQAMADPANVTVDCPPTVVDITGGDGEGIPIPPLPDPEWGVADPPETTP